MISHLHHGFLSGRSCITQLLSTLHSIGQLLDKNIQSDILFLDFAKAFDSVDHSILLEKLKAYGISGNLHRWFTNYLQGRTQRVVIEGASSKWSPVTSGVPQGSILGPMLFLLFINDIPDVLSEGDSMSLYADDAKLLGQSSLLTIVLACRKHQSLDSGAKKLTSTSMRLNARFSQSPAGNLLSFLLPPRLH